MSVDEILPICNAINNVGRRVNLIGIALEIGIPRTTSGTDCCCWIRIVDETKPEGITIRFFIKTMENLPAIRDVGDIVVVTDVLIKKWDTDIYAMFNTQKPSFALFHRRDPMHHDEFQPYQRSPKYTINTVHKNKIRVLRRCSIGDKIEAMHSSLSVLSLPLEEIGEGEQLDILCKILHIAEIETNEWMLFVWDGTDAPSLPLEATLEDEMRNPLPLAVEPLQLPREILCTFPTVGTVLRIFVDHGRGKLGIRYIRSNCWAKILNIKCEARGGLWRGVLTYQSKICYLPDDDNTSMLRQSSHKERFASKWERMPMKSLPWPSPITMTDHPDLPFVTLMDVLTNEEVEGKFKCVVRVIAFLSWRSDFRNREEIYMVRLTLEDPTARIHAFVYGEDGNKFFGEDSSDDVLMEKRNKLLGADGAPSSENDGRKPPWIQCCIKSYSTDSNDEWGSRNFQIFDTICV